MSSLKRFLHLEGRRQERSPSAPAKDGRSRFSALESERAGGAPAEAPPAGTLERFERQVSDQPLATAPRPLDEQPFIRCMSCHADNGRFAQECIHCAAPLHTPAQEEFNRQLWEERLRHRAEERQVSAAKDAEQRKAMAEELFHRELQRQQLKEAFAEEGRSQLFGMRLLGMIKDPLWRKLVIALLVTALTGISIAAYRGNDDARMTLFVSFLLAVALFTPPRMWLRRRRRWWEDDDTL